MKRLTSLLALALLLLLLPSSASAQAVSTSKLAWDQAAPDLASAQAYAYKYYADGAAAGVALASVVCTGSASPFQCEVAYPAFTPGSHSLTLSATNAAGESIKSAVFTFTFVVVPSAPANLRIK